MWQFLSQVTSIYLKKDHGCFGPKFDTFWSNKHSNHVICNLSDQNNCIAGQNRQNDEVF